MNKVIFSKISNKKVTILINSKKQIIGYCLEKFTPKYKRTLLSYFTTDRVSAKKWLKH